MNKKTNTNTEKPLCFRQGKRVVLRPLLKADLSYLIRWINDPRVTKFLRAYWPAMEAKEESWIDDLAKSKTDLVLVITIEDGTPIGVIGLHQISWHDRTAVTGSFIGEPEYWSKGYGSEAKMLLLHYAFHTLNLRKICSSVIAFNKRSYGCLVKCGYRREGRQRAQHFCLGRYWDEIFLAVYQKTWKPLWQKWCQENHLEQ